MSDIDNTHENEASERRRSFRLDMEKEIIDIVWVDNNGDEKRKKNSVFRFFSWRLKSRL
jgi:hypothetical protein